MPSISALQDITKYAKEKKALLIAVSKTKPIADLQIVYNAGQKDFGENRVQELTAKHSALPKDIRWHMIGNLQTNKVKYIAPFVHLIHSVGSLKLAIEIDKQAQKNNRTIDVLLEIHIAAETNKSGFYKEELMGYLNENAFKQLKHIRICGLMGMATYTENEEQLRDEFRSLKKLFNELKEVYFKEQPEFCQISMGMSGDYKIALEEGSTMIRIGSTIFGNR
jgi:pyridoxal phosphate enzyme (YggS family)